MVKKSDFEGGLGFVYVFLVAVDVQDAVILIQKYFSNRVNKLLEIEFIARYEDVPWETEEENEKYKHLAEEALKSEELIFDDAYVYLKG